MTRAEILKSKGALENALTQQRLEGLKVSLETFALLTRVAKGEIPMSVAFGSLYARYARVKVLKL